jgi:hypothetical protein
MLFLNKSINENEIIVTVTENNTLDNPVYSMQIHSHFTNKSYIIELGLNLSEFTERFDKFIIENSLFQNIEQGVYVYKIFNQDNEGKSLETGYLKIEGAEIEEEFIEPTEDESDDDYIVYQN